MDGQNNTNPIKFPSGYAFIVGVGGNRNNPNDYVNATAKDAVALKDILEDPNMAGYDPDHIICLTYEEATKTNIIENRIPEFVTLVCDRQNYEESTVILYFSGHGVRIRDDYYFVPHNNTDQSLNDFANEPTNLISFPQLTELFELLRPVKRQITFFDCCHSGGANALNANVIENPADNLTTTPSTEIVNNLKEGMATLVITSCGEDQKSYVKGDNSHTIFGECLFEALYGKGQSIIGIGDNNVYLGGLSDYLAKNVPKRTKAEYPTRFDDENQIPTPTKVEKASGTVAICRSKLSTKTANTAEPIVPALIGPAIVRTLGIEVSPTPTPYANGKSNWVSLFLNIFLLTLSVIAGIYLFSTYGKYLNADVPMVIDLPEIIDGNRRRTIESNSKPNPRPNKYVGNANKPCGFFEKEAETPIKFSLLLDEYIGTGTLTLKNIGKSLDKPNPFLPIIYVFDENGKVIEVVCPKNKLDITIKSGEGKGVIWITYSPEFKASYHYRDTLKNTPVTFLKIGVKTQDIKDLNDLTSDKSGINRIINISKLLNDSETPYYFYEYLRRLYGTQINDYKKLKDKIKETFVEPSPETSNLYQDVVSRVYFRETRQIGINLSEDEAKKMLDSYKRIILSNDFPLTIRKATLQAFISAPTDAKYNQTRTEIIVALEGRLSTLEAFLSNLKSSNSQQKPSTVGDWEKPFLEEAITNLKTKDKGEK